MTATVIPIDRARKRVTTRSELREDSINRASGPHALERLRLTEGRENVLAQMNPPITKDWLTSREVIDYLGVTRSSLRLNADYHFAELRSVGYQTGDQKGKVSLFSRRAVLHIALITRQGGSARADSIKQALGTFRDRTATPPRLTRHERMCADLLNDAYKTVEAVHDHDPIEVWASLETMDRFDLQATVVALAALVPEDHPGLRKFLSRLGFDDLRAREVPAHPSRVAAAGLAVLIPHREEESTERDGA